MGKSFVLQQVDIIMYLLCTLTEVGREQEFGKKQLQDIL